MIPKVKCFVAMLLFAINSFSQTVDSVLVKGQVISKDNIPLPGVTIRVSNSDKTVFSDLYGQFELWTPIEGIIEFSCISEPYKVSLSSVGVPEKDEFIIFKFDLKHVYKSYKTKKLITCMGYKQVFIMIFY